MKVAQIGTVRMVKSARVGYEIRWDILNMFIQGMQVQGGTESGNRKPK